MAEPGEPAAWEMTADQEKNDRLTRGGKNAMPEPPEKMKMGGSQDFNDINPDVPGVIQSMHHEVPGTYEDI